MEEETETKTKINELEQKKREYNEKLQLANEKLEKRRAEIEAKKKAISDREKELAEKLKKIEKHQGKFKMSRFERTNDPKVYKFGNRTVQVRVLQGEMFVKYGSGYIRASSYAELCNKVDKKRFMEEQEKKNAPTTEVSPSAARRRLLQGRPRKGSNITIGSDLKAKRKRIKQKMRKHR